MYFVYHVHCDMQLLIFGFTSLCTLRQYLRRYNVTNILLYYLFTTIFTLITLIILLWSCRIKTRSRPSSFAYLLHIFTNV